MFGLSAGHILILAVVVLLFGGRKLPELGEGLGKGMRAFRAALEGKEVDPQTGRILADSRNETDGTPKNIG
ncbi:MAG TPA: twin-arginine translocase TatA/TatE family subunit [Bdellovibrionota bacterium]|jgi:sec-independent protein translocase protein TatA|nr:twin-arginine translocase TatA/TatE family subunit [Bdellovibrionota bacterium]